MTTLPPFPPIVQNLNAAIAEFTADFVRLMTGARLNLRKFLDYHSYFSHQISHLAGRTTLMTCPTVLIDVSLSHLLQIWRRFPCFCCGSRNNVKVAFASGVVATLKIIRRHFSCFPFGSFITSVAFSGVPAVHRGDKIINFLTNSSDSFSWTLTSFRR